MTAENMSHGFFLKSAFILLLSFTSFLLPAQKQAFNFSHLTRENGLPSNRTRCLARDFRGYIWIGTDNGLVRYDGRNTHVFWHDRNDPSSVIDNCINALFETHDSLLLIGAIDGLSVYNPFHQEFTGYSVYGRGKDSFPARSIHCFYEESGGTIWIGTEDGIVQMKRDPVKFTCFPLRKSKNKTDREYYFNHVTCIVQDPRDKNKLLLSTLGGLLQFDTGSKSICRDLMRPGSGGYGIIDMYLDVNRRLWSCGWGSGLNCLDLETGKWEEFPFDKQKPISIVGITPKSPHEFWLATIDHGLGIFDLTNHTFTFHQKVEGDDRSLLSNTVIRIVCLQDPEDIWILSDNGINILDQRRHPFRNVRIPFGHSGITSFSRDRDNGHLYVGATDSKGLFDLDERNSRWSIIPPAPGSGISGSSILVLYRDSRSVLWIGTRNGLFFLDRAKHLLVPFRLPDGRGLPLKEPRIYTITEDARQGLWLGTVSEGVIRIDSARSRAVHYQHMPGDPASFIDGGRIRAICPDRSKKLWIATDNGISIYDPATDCFNNGLMDTLLKSGITKRWVNATVCDSLGRIWMNIDGAGLLRVEALENGSFRYKLFGTTNGLNDPTPGRMTPDPRGGLWLINYGLLYINPFNEKILLFDEHNGLTRPLSFDESLYVDPDGSIFIGGIEGYETANIRDLDFSPLTIRLELESMEINGKNMPVDVFQDTNQVHILSAGQNSLLFRYTGICFRDVEQIIFRYRLEGFDRDWNMAGTGREARYTNLPPGKYRFVFQAANRGVWLQQEGSVQFIIRPLFWKTWWFVALLIAAFSAILLLIYRYRVGELLRLERLRTRIATDLHDDVGSTLSSISILSDIVARQVENPQSSKMLGTIGANARKMLEKIDDIIWVVNPTNDKFQNLGLRIREFAIPLFESGNIGHEISFDPGLNTLQLPMEVRKNLYLIAKEAVNNAVKYSGCSLVKISFKQEFAFLCMEVIDNGKGFDPDAPTSRNGIRNMKARAGQLNSVFEIRSAPGKGAVIRLAVKVK